MMKNFHSLSCHTKKSIDFGIFLRMSLKKNKKKLRVEIGLILGKLIKLRGGKATITNILI